jgi:hypothetical protein
MCLALCGVHVALRLPAVRGASVPSVPTRVGVKDLEHLPGNAYCNDNARLRSVIPVDLDSMFDMLCNVRE